MAIGSRGWVAKVFLKRLQVMLDMIVVLLRRRWFMRLGMVSWMRRQAMRFRHWPWSWTRRGRPLRKNVNLWFIKEI